MKQTKRFGKALRLARQQRGLAREDFVSVSSPNYLGEVERGEKRVTVDKLCELADVLDIHPASLLVFACLDELDEGTDLQSVTSRVEDEVSALVAETRRNRERDGRA